VEIEIWMKLAFIVTCLAKFNYGMVILRFNILLAVVFKSCLCWGQNLVPNPSFENVTQCPLSFGLDSYTTNWVSGRETPDYFNECAPWEGAMVPMNDYGYQAAKTGNAYIGMLTYRTDSSIYTEAASVQLSSQLTIGQTYYVSFQLSLTPEYDVAWSANNKIGVQFSTVQYSQSNPAPINNFAHVWTDSIITDTLGWQTIRGAFTADSGYTHLSIGNFFDAQNVDTILMEGDLIDLLGSYYFIDDVCVSIDSTLCYNPTSTNQLKLDLSKISIHPNPFSDFITVKAADQNGLYSLELYNLIGQQVYQADSFRGSHVIKTENFANGIYILKISSQRGCLSYKLLK
jgi:hypothetical protein